VLDILLQRHRETEAAKTFLIQLPGEDTIPEVLHSDQLQRYGATIREIPSLVDVGYRQVILPSRFNNLIEQQPSVASRAVLPQTATWMEAQEADTDGYQATGPDCES